ncbi:ATP-dependent protease LA lon domain-containing protein [Cinnamomum micranthum f. kanehirae]|uniref:ATP-dependent protease LA lon domain-containing protein n=1 Tax=Cinnamomum micranthum f. kanehirae TaxID=337451 RepID=A0A3S3NM97_9MAGN|nr:ATP-dependent protease LA lon domain-containing protein [Cinnamomum micranthum f. kanehirae]
MYDSYSLAQRVTDLWRQLIGSPSLDSLIKSQISYHLYCQLRREIQLLERFDLIRCRRCRTVIAKRTDMQKVITRRKHN